jgi:hypothetical protein
MSLRILRRLMLFAAAGVLVLAFVPAHAGGVAVNITTADGSTLYGVPYGLPLDNTITGTADFDNADGSVTIYIFHRGVFGGIDPAHPENAVADITNPEENQVHSGPASCQLDENFHCNWTFALPQIFGPGTDYRVVAVASEPDGLGGTIEANDQITVDIL